MVEGVGLVRMPRVIACALLLGMTPFAAEPVWAEQPLRGVALVIGNGEYEHLLDLPNPSEDAEEIHDLLDELGFDADSEEDLDARSLSRAFDRFVEDASGADVAVLYYAGHGIEAGGENYLLAVDTHPSTLDGGGERLVPLSPIVERLWTRVDVVIVLLDACRTSPFPSGAVLRRETGAPALPVAGVGLGFPRGAQPLDGRQPSSGDMTLATVIGFAAGPGQAALDGRPGEHSPYAAALLKHLGAEGADLSDTMALVTEEVYLKTRARQRPWVSASLRRLLRFDARPEPASPDEREIVAERRRLLLSIADFSEIGREQIERVATSADVPLDAIYAMLGALGKSAPEDPAELEKLLRAQAQELKVFFAKRQVVERPDPELGRLSELTERAVAEGALDAARRLRVRADQRIAALSQTLDEEEDDIRARRTEFAAEHARSAEVSALAFDHAAEAAYYRKAFEQIARWDDALAWRYRNAELDALTNDGLAKGATASLEEALRVADEAAAIASRMGDRKRWAQTQHDKAYALLTLGSRHATPHHLEVAVQTFESALTVRTREADLQGWLRTRNELAFTLLRLAERERDPGALKRAIDSYREILSIDFRHRFPETWGTTQFQLASALASLGEKTGDAAALDEAVEAFDAALTTLDRKSDPFNWAVNRNNKGATLRLIGQRRLGTEELAESVETLKAALEEMTAARSPTGWAGVMNNLGASQAALAAKLGDMDLMGEAVASIRQALTIITRESSAVEWATAQVNLVFSQVQLAIGRNDVRLSEEAVSIIKATEQVFTEQEFPLQWALLQRSLGITQYHIATFSRSSDDFLRSKESFNRALRVFAHDQHPAEWATTVAAEGMVLADWGWNTGDPALVEQGRDLLIRAQAQLAANGHAYLADLLDDGVARAEALLSQMQDEPQKE